MARCPNLDSEPVLILSAWRLVAGGNAKLVIHAVPPSFGWHEHDTSVPENNHKNGGGGGTHENDVPPTLACCVWGPLSLPVLSASRVHVQGSVLPVCVEHKSKMGDTRRPEKKEKDDFGRRAHHPQWSRCPAACVCLCVLVCVHAPKRPSLSPPLPFLSSCLNINE